ncbi:class I SAM-dependent methyltransferase [Parvibaculum sp.]|uniref:class I SAM-dependent methyltransferase n=1 Tax=Parvibaculum sp. TaxID=2024848 RepID=UPI000EDE6073|nr:hypothetical protein [Rhodobiaceae bacterium]
MRASGWYGFDFGNSPVGGLHAVDISLRRLDYVRQNVALARDRLSVVRADLLDLPYWPKSFDAVVTMHAVEPMAAENTKRSTSWQISRLTSCACSNRIIGLLSNVSAYDPDLKL